MPDELVAEERWIRYSSSKVPLTVRGAPASSVDPSTWSDYAEAMTSDAGVGPGFVLNGDGIVCLDLDHCLDGDVVAPWAAEILELVPPTYIEVSPSGDGLHVWGRGALERGRRVRAGAGVLEAYGSARYMTVTGRPFAGSVRCLASLDAVLTQFY